MSEKEEEIQKSARWLVEVPAPATTLCLGKPEKTFGYPGISMKTGKGFFMDVANASVFSHGASVTHMTSACFSVFTKRDLHLSSGSQANIVTKRLLVLGAGAGYSEDSDPGGGEAVYAPELNRADFFDLTVPCLKAVQKYDNDATQELIDFNVALGFAPPAAAIQAHAAHGYAIIELLKSLLLGGHGAPTANSMYVEEFIEEAGGLLGGLQKAIGLLNRLDRALQRPETLPLVGPLFGKAKQARDLVNTAYGVAGEATETFKGTAVAIIHRIQLHEKETELANNEATIKANEATIKANEGTIKANEKKVEHNEHEIETLEEEEKHPATPERLSEIKARITKLKGDNHTLEHENSVLEKANEGLETQNKTLETANEKLEEEIEEWKAEADDKIGFEKEFGRMTDDIGKARDGDVGAAMNVASVDIVHMMRPVRRFARALRDFTAVVGELVEQLAGFLGWSAPPPSALGLVAQHGVSMITPDRVFGYAGDGFHFVSKAVDPPDPASMAAKIKAFQGRFPFWYGRTVPRPTAVPGFFVDTTGNVQLRSATEVSLHAYGDHGRASVRAFTGIEAVAGSTVGIAARTGCAEVTGKQLYLGIPMTVPLAPASATVIARKALLQAGVEAAIQTANDTHQAELQKIPPLQARLVELQQEETLAVAKVTARGGVGGGIGAEHPLQLAVNLKAEKVVAKQLEIQAQIAVAAAALVAKQVLDQTLVDLLGPLNPSLDPAVVAARAVTDNQSLTDTVGVVALKEVSVFSPGKVSALGAEVSIKATDPAIPASPLTPPATIDAGAAGVKIAVGDWIVEVKKDGVTIGKSAGGAQVKIDAAGVTINASTGEIRMKTMTANLETSKACNISGAQITLG